MLVACGDQPTPRLLPAPFQCAAEAQAWSLFTAHAVGADAHPVLVGDELLVQWRARGGVCAQAEVAPRRSPAASSSTSALCEPRNDFVACGLSVLECDTYCRTNGAEVEAWARVWQPPAQVHDDCREKDSRCACELAIPVLDGGSP